MKKLALAKETVRNLTLEYVKDGGTDSCDCPGTGYCTGTCACSWGPAKL